MKGEKTYEIDKEDAVTFKMAIHDSILFLKTEAVKKEIIESDMANIKFLLAEKRRIYKKYEWLDGGKRK